MNTNGLSESRGRKPRGSVLLTAIMAVTILGLIVGSYLVLTTTEQRNAHRQAYWNQTLEVAEAGLEIGISHVQARDLAGWGAISPDVMAPSSLPLTITDVSGQKLGTAGVAVIGFVGGSRNPIVQATGYVATPPQGIVVKRTVRAILDLQDSGAINAKQSVDFSGGNVKVDSYRESLGTYASQVVAATGHAGENADVLAFSSLTPAINVSNSTIWGEAETGAGGTVSTGPGGLVSGETWDGLSATLNDVVVPAGMPPVQNINDYSVPGGWALPGSADPANPTKYHFNDLTIVGTKTLTVNGYVEILVDDDFTIGGAGSMVVAAGGGAAVYIGDDVAISGNAIINQTGSPKNVSLYGLNGSTDWSVNGNGTWSGTIYAPYADLKFNGGGVSGDAYGVIGANTVAFTGGTNLHYEETMKIGNIMFAFPFKVDSWTEVTPPIDTP